MKMICSLCLLVSLFIAVPAANAQTNTATAPTKSTADSASLKAYVGSYTFSGDSPIQTYTISTSNGELFGEANSYGKYKLIKQGKADTYQSTSSYASMITFVRDATTQAVTSLTMAIQGTEMTAKRDKP